MNIQLAILATLVGSCFAATGYVNLGVQNPSGCYPNEILPLLLDNQTDQPAYVYPSTDCTGAAAQLPAGKAGGFKQARS
ncbi:hypothetical protein CPB97_001891 [Podila verticillata]|nr:hypothetical protein CPB97_001891 [Podila verticillata]